MLSKRLKYLRNKNDKTQQEVANYLNISRPRYAQYESGKRQPDYDMLKQIAKYFHVSVDYLLSTTDNPNQEKAEDPPVVSKAYHALDELDEEDIKKVEEYIEFIKSQKKFKKNN